MFDIAPSELMLVALVALVVIGPKDLPKAMRFVGYWVGKGRGVMRQFRSGFDSMMREAELKELEAKWAAENERIMREYPSSTPQMLPMPEANVAADIDEAGAPQLTPMPHIEGVPAGARPSDADIAAAEGLPPIAEAAPRQP